MAVVGAKDRRALCDVVQAIERAVDSQTRNRGVAHDRCSTRRRPFITVYLEKLALGSSLPALIGELNG
jgi:hypothetical protein